MPASDPDGSLRFTDEEDLYDIWAYDHRSLDNLVIARESRLSPAQHAKHARVQAAATWYRRKLLELQKIADYTDSQYLSLKATYTSSKKILLWLLAASVAYATVSQDTLALLLLSFFLGYATCLQRSQMGATKAYEQDRERISNEQKDIRATAKRRLPHSLSSIDERESREDEFMHERLVLRQKSLDYVEVEAG